MLILLPPSEGKTAPSARRRAFDLEGLSFPALAGARRTVLDRLVEVSAAPDACGRLGVGASLEAEVRANVGLADAPAAPAGEIYSGVLYEALDLASLDAAGRRRAARSLLVVSALWGAVRMTDRIPAYRLSMTVDLPGIGPMAKYWRPQLSEVLDPLVRRGVVVDCRSASYQQAWPGSAPERTAMIRVVSRDSGTAVSHMAKLTRGLVARHLCERAGSTPRTPEQLAHAVAERFEVGLAEPRSARSSWTLDVVEP